jgi:hypothetical protein
MAARPAFRHWLVQLLSSRIRSTSTTLALMLSATSLRVLLAAVLAVLWATALPAQDAPHVARLEQYGLLPTSESLTGYLASLTPTAERKAELARFVWQLGDSQFARREEASRFLASQVGGVVEVLKEATQHEDAEIRWRAKEVLDQNRRESRALLDAALAVIASRKLPGLCPALLAALPACQDDAQRAAVRRALAATAAPDEIPFLRRQVAHPDADVRVAAIYTLSHLAAAGTEEDALRLLADSRPVVRVAAARVLANYGHREALSPLVKLLSAEETGVRAEALRTLQGFTGQQFGFAAYDPPEKRTPAVAAWQKWLEEESAAARLTFPLAEAPPELGRLLVCDHNQNVLMEFDAAGQKTWQRSVDAQPWACLGLSNGHRLVGSFQEKCVVEFDAAGEKTWEVSGLPGGPTSIQRLENGNTLIACTEAQQVVEIDPAKTTVWRATLDGRPVDARRLDDGRTLVALQHGQKVVEIDSAGKIVWEIAGVGMAFSAERLPSGNTLVASIGNNQVREYDRSGNVVWSQGDFVNPYGAQRLASGNTIVVDTTGVTEIDPMGAVISRLEMPNLSRMWRY